MDNQFEVQRSLGRIEGGIIELKSDVSLMRTDHALLREEFTKLEAGRLTRLESAFAIQDAISHNKAKNTAIIYSIVTGLAISIGTLIINHYFHI